MNKQKKSEVIIFNATPKFKAMLYEMSEKQDKPVSQIVREAVLKANEKKLQGC